jgi:hypothetical protein
MGNYEWSKAFETIWSKAVERYQGGKRGSADFFTKEEQSFLDSIGMTAQELYDFAEDFAEYGEPDFSTCLLVTAARRDYFLTIQHGKPTGKTVPMSTLPAKTDKLEGIKWLPRLIEKAKIKLRGEMEPDLMYGCGGDRNFFKEHGLHPADFLRVAWAAKDDKSHILNYVKTRSY